MTRGNKAYRQIRKEYLNFCAWNIQGINSRQIGIKLRDKDFLDMIKDEDFMSLSETHAHNENIDNLNIPGFKRVAYKNYKKKLKSEPPPGELRCL